MKNDPALEKRVSDIIERLLAAALQRAVALTAGEENGILLDATGDALDDVCCEYAELFFESKPRHIHGPECPPFCLGDVDSR